MMIRPRQVLLWQIILHFSWTATAPQTGQTIDGFRSAFSPGGMVVLRGSDLALLEASFSPCFIIIQDQRSY